LIRTRRAFPLLDVRKRRGFDPGRAFKACDAEFRTGRPGPDLLQAVLRSIELRLNGERAAGNTIRIKRAALRDALDFAVEKKLLTTNSMNEMKTKKTKLSFAG
jgi:hypothetical protein